MSLQPVPIQNVPGVPDYTCTAFLPKSSDYCLLIPVINEGSRILTELGRAQKAGVDRLVDIVICDGGSTDGSMNPDTLELYGVNTLLVKTGPGKQEFLFPAGERHPARFQAPEKGIADNKAREEHCNGCEVLQQHFGGDEGCAPDQDSQQGGNVPKGFLAARHEKGAEKARRIL